MNNIEIVPAHKSESELLARIVSKSNKDVAKLLSLTIDNAPKHPSFCTAEWILGDFERGQEYFLSIENGEPTGCVAFEHPDKNTAYLNRLSVLPEFRKRGLGKRLVTHIVDYSRNRQVKAISIGIIAEHTQLRQWYRNIGFIEGDLQRFDHLPFDVLYMRYSI